MSSVSCNLARFAVAAIVAALPGAFEVARAAAVPDSAAIARLRGAADSAWRMRIVTADRRLSVTRPQIDSTGVGGAPGTSPALIRWSEIERLETETPATLPGFVKGAVIGAMLGGLVFLYAPLGDGANAEEETWKFAWTVFGVSTLTGGIVGATIGSGIGVPHPLYP